MGDIADEYEGQAISELGDRHAGIIAEPPPEKGLRSELYVSWPNAEIQTDKDTAKIVHCTECEKPLIVNVFYAAAQAKCSEHRGARARSNGEQAIVQKGRTDPAKAARLADCLINPQFAFARCPVHPDDDAHEMELKSVDHHDYHGPSMMVQSGSRPEYRQTARGETVMHQCGNCKAVVTYSTTAQTNFRALNEPTKNRKDTRVWAEQLGSRETV